MVTKKDLVIVVLATFYLTALLFLIIPTRSSPNRYDPWLDVNDDGKIDIVDISALALAFQSQGDPTKSVMPATSSGRYVWVNPLPNVSDGYHLLPIIETKGYRRIYFSLVGNSRTFSYVCNLTIGWRTQGTFNESSYWVGQVEHYEDFETGIKWSAWREFDIKGETMIIWLGDTYADSYDISYYMTG